MASLPPEFDTLDSNKRKWLDAMVRSHVQISRKYRLIQALADRDAPGVTDKGVVELTHTEFEWWRKRGGATYRPTEERYSLKCEIALMHVERGFRGSTVVNHTGQLLIRCHHCKAYLNNGLWVHAAKCKRLEHEKKPHAETA